MIAANELSSTEMWEYLAKSDGKSVDQVKEFYGSKFPDLDLLKHITMQEMRLDVVREKIDCMTLGENLASAVARFLEMGCSRGQDGHLVYKSGWSDEVVAQRLSEDLFEICAVADIRENLDELPFIAGDAALAGAPGKYVHCG